MPAKAPASAIAASSSSCGASKSVMSPGAGTPPVLKSMISSVPSRQHVDAVGRPVRVKPAGQLPLALDLGMALGDLAVARPLELEELPRRASRSA